MAVEVFSGEYAANLGDDEAGLPSHDWDKRQANPDQLPRPEVIEKITPDLGKVAQFMAWFDEKDWAPARKRRPQESPDSFVQSDQ
jgi:hypothetical protein